MNLQQQEQDYEKKRNAAIKRKYKHIKLILGPGISPRKRIAGVEGVNAWQIFDRKSNRREWEFDITQGGEIKFDIDENEEYVAWVFSSDFNKRFLGSHYPLGLWEIENPKIDAEIRKLSEEMAKGIKKEDTGKSPTLIEIEQLSAQIYSGEFSEPEEVRAQARLKKLIEKFQEEISPGNRPSRNRLSILKGLVKRKNISKDKMANHEKELAELTSQPEGMVQVE